MGLLGQTSYLRIQAGVFALVSAAFLNIYITQPVLPVLQEEFASDMVRVSLTVSAVILGIALSNLPLGYLSDRWPIHPMILTGGLVVALAGGVCALTHSLWMLIGTRFVQGLFIPSLTTCLAAYLAKTLPGERLNVVMGAYVSATVLGGLGGRLLGGWLHPPLHWRYAFVSAAGLTLLATVGALWAMPPAPRPTGGPNHQPAAGFPALLGNWRLVRLFCCAAGSFAIFSSIFNYLPFRLAGPPFDFATEQTTLLYLVYVIGIFMGPVAGRISNRLGGGNTLIAGAAVLGAALVLVALPAVTAVVIGLLGVCTGFFTIHAAAVGALNRRLTSGQGRANALYVLFYYAGGWLGITAAGLAYQRGGWSAVLLMVGALLAIPILAGLGERKGETG
ncbi:MAG: MFS transporter [Desulfobacterales bacterium]|nr:MFS transporter [Desulfobacterales bacterium]